MRGEQQAYHLMTFVGQSSQPLVHCAHDYTADILLKMHSSPGRFQATHLYFTFKQRSLCLSIPCRVMLFFFKRFPILLNYIVDHFGTIFHDLYPTFPVLCRFLLSNSNDPSLVQPHLLTPAKRMRKLDLVCSLFPSHPTYSDHEIERWYDSVAWKSSHPVFDTLSEALEFSYDVMPGYVRCSMHNQPLKTTRSWHIEGDTCTTCVEEGACTAKLPSGGCFVGIL